VETDFNVPSGMGQFLRIYVVLDPDNTMQEVHENNNRGWTVLALGTSATSVGQNPAMDLAQFRLEQNYPNPFNPRTAVTYQVPATSHVLLAVYDILGRNVAQLVNEQKVPGLYSVMFDASGLSSGVYFYRLQTGSFVQTRKMILLR
jgi:hypothetical protein